MGIEIERKFLVAGDGWRPQVVSSKRIRQAYLSTGGAAAVRVRIVDERRARLTIKSSGKSGSPALSRAEFEYSVPVEDALAMLDLRAGQIVEKTRHLVPAGNGRTWEVDVFGGAHEGLVIAEIELEAPDEPVALPDWVGREVTGDPRYGNVALAQR